jgi:hypothetical protein
MPRSLFWTCTEGYARDWIKKLMQKDVLYYMVDNLPSQEETRETVTQLEPMMEQASDGSY